jgi:hypothetical protein
MIKIKLSLESLRVESFATAATGRGQGTVLGNAKTTDCATADTCRVVTGCGPDCETYYPAGCISSTDECPSSPHGNTAPCNGCVETELC